MADLAAHLRYPLLIVARLGLGTINHTLLTIEALRRRNLEVAGAIMVGDRNADNRDAIERYGGVGVVGEMPLFASLTPESLAQWSKSEFDTDGRLARYFQ